MGFEELSHAGVIKALSRLLGEQQGLALLAGSDAKLLEMCLVIQRQEKLD